MFRVQFPIMIFNVSFHLVVLQHRQITSFENVPMVTRIIQFDQNLG